MLRQHQPRQILLSKRNYIFYVDRVKVVGELGNVRLVSKSDHNKAFEEWLNVPQRNTSLLLLGHGTSITNEAMRLLSEANVIVGFCGTGGSPTYAMSDYVFTSYVDNYRPTEYFQKWFQLWNTKRLEAAKIILSKRISDTEKCWTDNDFLSDRGVVIGQDILNKTLQSVDEEIDVQQLLLVEARWKKYLYKILAENCIGGTFVREKVISDDKTKQNKINGFLNHGNYLAYGLAAVALHGLGIGYAFPLLHGRTRNGGLVLDVADLFKDSYILPLAFEYGSSRKKVSQNVFRARAINRLHDKKVVNYCFNMIKDVISELTEN